MVAAVAVLLSGCITKVVYVRDPTKSETEVKVEAIKDEWLDPCAGLPKAKPGNDVGNLLGDYNTLAGVAATCIARQRSFVEYLRPIVQKERARIPEKDPVTPQKN